MWDVAWALKTLSWDYPTTTGTLHRITGIDVASPARYTCFALGGFLMIQFMHARSGEAASAIARRLYVIAPNPCPGTSLLRSRFIPTREY